MVKSLTLVLIVKRLSLSLTALKHMRILTGKKPYYCQEVPKPNETEKVIRKRISPSKKRRNVRRRREYLAGKESSPTSLPSSASPPASEEVTVTEVTEAVTDEFKCNLCDYSSELRLNIRTHVRREHHQTSSLRSNSTNVA